MMKVPRFWRLAEIDDRRFITACRPGSIHLTWERVTLRFTRDEFRHWAGLLDRAAGTPPPVSVGDGMLQVHHRAAEGYELRIGPVALLLSHDEFQQLVEAARRAVDHLDEILASGVWDKPDLPEAMPRTLDDLFRTPFSES